MLPEVESAAVKDGKEKEKVSERQGEFNTALHTYICLTIWLYFFFFKYQMCQVLCLCHPCQNIWPVSTKIQYVQKYVDT